MSESSILILGGRVLDPSRKVDQVADVLIENGLISAIEKPGQIPKQKATKTVDAAGKWILPGFVDVHVHLREPGQEYKETIQTGTRAAVAGGFTSVACMANTNPVNDTPYVTAFIREKAKEFGSCRVYPIGALSKGLRGEELAEIGGMVEEGARAISDDGMTVMNAYLMRKAMDYCKAFGVPVVSHAEDVNLVGQGVMNESALSSELGLRGIPGAAEEIIVARDIALARLTGCPIHIAHVSTGLSLDHIRRAKEEGLLVTAEVTPHHLTLTEECLRSYDTRYKMAPCLRSETDVEKMRQAVRDGVIDMIATDHAPHGLIDKACEFDQAANGIVGLETALSVTYALVEGGGISLSRWIESMTTAPAQFLKIPAGTLAPGAAADLLIWDPKARWRLSPSESFSKSQNSPYTEQDLMGRVLATFVAGRQVHG